MKRNASALILVVIMLPCLLLQALAADLDQDVQTLLLGNEAFWRNVETIQGTLVVVNKYSPSYIQYNLDNPREGKALSPGLVYKDLDVQVVVFAIDLRHGLWDSWAGEIISSGFDPMGFSASFGVPQEGQKAGVWPVPMKHETYDGAMLWEYDFVRGKANATAADRAGVFKGLNSLVRQYLFVELGMPQSVVVGPHLGPVRNVVGHSCPSFVYTVPGHGDVIGGRGFLWVAPDCGYPILAAENRLVFTSTGSDSLTATRRTWDALRVTRMSDEVALPTRGVEHCYEYSKGQGTWQKSCLADFEHLELNHDIDWTERSHLPPIGMNWVRTDENGEKEGQVGSVEYWRNSVLNGTTEVPPCNPDLVRPIADVHTLLGEGE